MKKIAVIAFAVFLALGFTLTESFAAQTGTDKAGSTMGTTQSGSEKGTGTMGSAMMQGAMRASKLMDKTVKDQQGQELGKVEDVVVGNQGRVSFVILSGPNDRLYPIPMQALQRRGEDEFVANISKDRLTNAPNFAENQWPDLAGADWHQRVFSYYGQEMPSGMMQQPSTGTSTMPQSGTTMQPRTDQPATGTTTQPRNQ